MAVPGSDTPPHLLRNPLKPRLWSVQMSFNPLNDLDDGPKASSITTVKFDLGIGGVGLNSIPISLTRLPETIQQCHAPCLSEPQQLITVAVVPLFSLRAELLQLPRRSFTYPTPTASAESHLLPAPGGSKGEFKISKGSRGFISGSAAVTSARATKPGFCSVATYVC
jgi:hypothetical protein